MSSLDGLNFEDMLNKVAGPDVDIGEPKKSSSKKEENEISPVEGKKQIMSSGSGKGKSKKIGNVQKKVKLNAAKNRNSFSPTLVRKDLIKLIGVLHPDLSTQNSVNLILQNYIAKNKDKINKVMDNSLEDRY